MPCLRLGSSSSPETAGPFLFCHLQLSTRVNRTTGSFVFRVELGTSWGRVCVAMFDSRIGCCLVILRIGRLMPLFLAICFGLYDNWFGCFHIDWFVLTLVADNGTMTSTLELLRHLSQPCWALLRCTLSFDSDCSHSQTIYPWKSYTPRCWACNYLQSWFCFQQLAIFVHSYFSWGSEILSPEAVSASCLYNSSHLLKHLTQLWFDPLAFSCFSLFGILCVFFLSHVLGLRICHIAQLVQLLIWSCLGAQMKFDVRCSSSLPTSFSAQSWLAWVS